MNLKHQLQYGMMNSNKGLSKKSIIKFMKLCHLKVKFYDCLCQ